MAKVTYEIVPHGEKWHIAGSGPDAVAYVTREAAFESVVASVWVALKAGDDVTIRIHAREGADIV